MKKGIESMRQPRSISDMTMTFLRFSLSTQTPAIGPIMNTGIIVKEMSFANASSEPGLRW